MKYYKKFGPDAMMDDLLFIESFIELNIQEEGFAAAKEGLQAVFQKIDKDLDNSAGTQYVPLIEPEDKFKQKKK